MEKAEGEHTSFEQDAAQSDECVRHLEPHLVVSLHMLLVYRAREIKHLPRSIEIIFGLCLVFSLTLTLALPIAITIASLFPALRIRLGHLSKEIYHGIIFLFCITQEQQDLVSIQHWLCMRLIRRPCKVQTGVTFTDFPQQQPCCPVLAKDRILHNGILEQHLPVHEIDFCHLWCIFCVRL